MKRQRIKEWFDGEKLGTQGHPVPVRLALIKTFDSGTRCLRVERESQSSGRIFRCDCLLPPSFSWISSRVYSLPRLNKHAPFPVILGYDAQVST